MPSAAPPSLTFVLCVERGQLEGEALALVRSIRRMAGALAGAAVVSVAPRPGREPGADTIAALGTLGVEHRNAPLNTRYPDHKLANKVTVAAWAERTLDSTFVVFLDTDTAFLDEPAALLLADGVDAAAVPVYQRGIGSTGADPVYPFWERIYRICGVTERRTVRTLCDDVEILAYWNSGLVSVRRAAGIFGMALGNFERAMAQWDELSLDRLYLRRHSTLARQWQDKLTSRELQGYLRLNTPYFIEQATLSATMIAMGAVVRQLPVAYNFPILLHDFIGPARRPDLGSLVSVHCTGQRQYRESKSDLLDRLRADDRGSGKLRYFIDEVWPANDRRIVSFQLP